MKITVDTLDEYFEMDTLTRQTAEIYATPNFEQELQTWLEDVAAEAAAEEDQRRLDVLKTIMYPEEE